MGCEREVEPQEDSGVGSKAMNEKPATSRHGAGYSLAGVVRGSRCGLRSGPSFGRFRPGGPGVRRGISGFRGDAGLSLDRLAMSVEPTEASTLRLWAERSGCYGRRAGEWGNH